VNVPAIAEQVATIECRDMKRRNMGGILKARISFGEKDAGPRSSLHRRMGIQTFIHLQAMTDYARRLLQPS
jgi:hypothetical protein